MERNVGRRCDAQVVLPVRCVLAGLVDHMRQMLTGCAFGIAVFLDFLPNKDRPDVTSLIRGRHHEASCLAERVRRLRMCLASHPREAPGHRPRQLCGAAFNGWTRAGRTRAKACGSRAQACPAPEARSRAPKIAAVERRQACAFRHCSPTMPVTHAACADKCRHTWLRAVRILKVRLAALRSLGIFPGDDSPWAPYLGIRKTGTPVA
jgi:hypothetical protein